MSFERERTLTPLERLENETITMVNNLADGFATALRNNQTEFRNELNNISRDVDRRINEQNSRINNLRNDIRNVERRTNEQFRRQRQEMHQHVNRLNDRIDQQAQRFERGFNEINNQLIDQRVEYRNLIRQSRNELNRKLNNQRNEYLNLIDDTRNEIENQRKHFQNEIKNIYKHLSDTTESQRNDAENIKQAAEYVINDILNNYNPEKFKPGAIKTLQEELNQGSKWMKSSTYQTAISSFERVYLEGRRLREELHLLNLEWETNLNIAKHKVIEALSVHEAHSNTKFSIDTEEREIEIDGNVDYWTNGAFNNVKEEITNYTKSLDNPEDLTKEDLIRITTEIEKRIQSMHILATLAKENLISSQMRVTIADDVLTSLEDAAWQLSDSTYHGEDDRGNYHMKLENAAGDEVVVVVSAERDESGSLQYKLETDYFVDGPMSEQSYMSVEQGIGQALNEIGYNTRNSKCRQGTENQPSGDKKRLNFNKVRTEKPKIQNASINEV